MTGRFVKAGVSVSLTATMLFAAVAASFAQAPQSPRSPQNGAQRSRSRVIVELRLDTPRRAEADLPDAAAVAVQRQAIGAGAARVLADLPQADHRIVRRYVTVPYLAMEVTPEARATLERHGDVLRVHDDTLVFPLLEQNVPLVEGDQAWASGFDGTGTVLAVLDSGVDASHPMLAGKVVEEACFSTTDPRATQTLCPNGLEQQIGPGAAAACPTECYHGTHVAGIAAGNDQAAVPAFAGVARGANVFAIQVFSRVIDSAKCGGTPTCLGAFTSDVIAGLEHVYSVALTGEHEIAAVNLSLGGEIFTAPCDSEPYKPAIDNLRSIGVATVAASGNSGMPYGIATPACISSVISVGSTGPTDTVSWFSNTASFLSLLAPGESIVSSVPGGAYAALSGTSMAAPFVTGAFSVLRHAAPAAGVGDILSSLRNTGLPVRDDRLFGSTVVPRIRIFRALASLVPADNPAPSISATDPTRARAGSPDLTLMVTGDGFNTFSVVRWNGADAPTRVLSTKTLEATISTAQLAMEGTAFVSVHTPGPGGGTSGAIAFTIDPPPAIAVSAATVAPGSVVTASLTRAFGGASDYLTLAERAAPDTSYLSWIYVGAGVTEKTWTVTLPMTAGTYEFRLYVDGVRRATSPPVTVDPALHPSPVISGVSPAYAFAGGSSFTLTVTGSRFVSSSVVRWNGSDRPTTVVGAAELRATIRAEDIAVAGVAQVTVFTPAPGGGSAEGVSFTVRAAPTISVSATTAAGGASVTATVSNSPGSSGDWLALASTTAPNGTYTAYTFVGAGVTNRTWTVSMPMTPGSYEFRLFTSSGTRLATSPAVVVGGPSLAVAVTEAVPGAPITVTLVNGTGGSGDWLAFAARSAADSAYLKYTYVGAGVTTRTWTVSAPATPGTYEFRMYVNNGYTRVATSGPVTVAQAAVAITSLSPASAPAGGSAFTLTVNGSGFDAGSLVRWNGADRTTTFVSATQLRAAIPAADIAQPGTAQVTVFSAANGLSAASPFAITTAPVLTPGSTEITTGSSVTVTLTGGSGSATDWLAIAPVGAPNGSYLQYTYVGAGVTTRTWSVVIAAPGTYEFRLFRNGYERVATSAPVTATDTSPAVLTVSTTEAARGTPVTVTLTNGRGGVADWLAFAPTGAANNSYLQWVYVGSGVTTRTWTVTMPNTAGTYEFRLFLNNGYTRIATSPSITVP